MYYSSMAKPWEELTTAVSGELDRPVVGLEWNAPEVVNVADGGIEWKGRGKRVRPGAQMLEAFLGLALASDQQIQAYALRWGVLGICKHGLPFGWAFHTTAQKVEVCLPIRWKGWDPPSGPGGWEPLSSWRTFSRQANAIANLASSVHQGRRGRPEDVLAARESMPKAVRSLSPHLFADPAKTVDEQRELVAAVIQDWLWFGSVMLHFEWSRRGVEVGFGGMGFVFGLFGALAVQLVLIVSGPGGLAFCHGCGQPYAPQRRPKARQRNYCRSCGRPAAVRDAVKAYRGRRATVFSLYRKGTTIPQIADQTGLAKERIRRWIERPSKIFSGKKRS